MDKKIIEFLESVEGLRLKAYQDGGGVWTIGIGNTYYEKGTPVKKGDIITRERAYSLATTILPTYKKAVKNFVKIELTDNQFIALVSLAYNIGGGAFGKLTLVDMINTGATPATITARWMITYITDNGKHVPGLVNRRRKEVTKYFQV